MMLKMIRQLAVCATLLVGYAANAGVISDSGVSVGLALGANWVFEKDLDFLFSVPNDTLVASYERDGLGSSASVVVGYTEANSGVGINLELQYNSFAFRNVDTDSLANSNALVMWNDSIKLRSIGAFSNVDVHTDFGANATGSTDAALALYASAGIGFVSYQTIDALVYDSNFGLVNFSGDSDMLLAFKVKIGGEIIFNGNTALGINAGMMFISDVEAINIKQVAVGDPTMAVPADLESFGMPKIRDGFVELKLTHFFTTNA